MNLLGAILYDPAVAVSKATSALLALTALDTTNLRITFTVPAHGKVRVRMKGVLHGATTFPTILLGVLEGATLRGRMAPVQSLGNTAVATAMVSVEADYCVTGLAAGSVSWDASYAVQTVVASTGLKYGGPNDNVGNDAFGGFLFEIYDPQPVPTAAPGAAGGVLIAGSNAPTTFAGSSSTAGLTITGGSSATGALTITGGSSSGAGVIVTTTSGDGMKITATGGNGIALSCISATGKHGFVSTGGTNGHGIFGIGTGSGSGFNAAARRGIHRCRSRNKRRREVRGRRGGWRGHSRQHHWKPRRHGIDAHNLHREHAPDRRFVRADRRRRGGTNCAR